MYMNLNIYIINILYMLLWRYIGKKNRRNIHGDTEATSRLRITLPFVAWHGTEPTTMGLYTHLNHAQLPNAEAAGQWLYHVCDWQRHPHCTKFSNFLGPGWVSANCSGFDHWPWGNYAQVFLFILIQLGFDRGRPENGQEIFFRKDGLQYLGQSNLFVKLQCLLACQYWHHSYCTILT